MLEELDTVHYVRGHNLGCSTGANRSELQEGELQEVRALGLSKHATEWELKRRIHNRKGEGKDWHVIKFMGDDCGTDNAQPLECERCGSRWTVGAWRCIARGQKCNARAEEAPEKPWDSLSVKERQHRFDRWKRQEGLVKEHNTDARQDGLHVVKASEPKWKEKRGIDPGWICRNCDANPKATGMRKFLSNLCAGRQ